MVRVIGALVAPAVVVISASTILALAGFAGYTPLTAPPDLTLSEAAAIRDEAEVVRQIGEGADPNGSALVRRGMLSDGDYMLTPLEAATASRHVEIVRLLLREGAELNGANFQTLNCLAQEGHADDIVALLKEHAPAGSSSTCEGVRLPL